MSIQILKFKILSPDMQKKKKYFFKKTKFKNLMYVLLEIE